jgi:ADP-ribosylglycohydrolase
MVSTIPQVLYLLRFHRGPRDVLLSSVHVGGDVDSVAALALATVAALEGCQWGTPRGLPWKLLEEPGVGGALLSPPGLSNNQTGWFRDV